MSVQISNLLIVLASCKSAFKLHRRLSDGCYVYKRTITDEAGPSALSIKGHLIKLPGGSRSCLLHHLLEL